MKRYLSDKAVGGGVGGGASVRALEPALPLGVLSLRAAGSRVRETGGRGKKKRKKTERKVKLCRSVLTYPDVFQRKPGLQGAWQPLTFGTAFLRASEHDLAVRWQRR